MKITRYGNTETHLLFINYLIKYENVDPNLKKQLSQTFMTFVNYLYSDSGYYDKKVKGNVFNFDMTALTPNFWNYIKELEVSCGDCDEFLYYGSDGINSLIEQCKSGFKLKYNVGSMRTLNGTRLNDRIAKIYDYIRDKRVLVVSSFGGLTKQQYDNGNIYKIYPNFPKIISLDYIDFPYCFNNNGPHENYFETCSVMYNKIKEKEDSFDVILMSCAAFGHILTHKCHSELKKDIVYLGGSIQEMFGIASKREKEAGFIKTNEYWITHIPDEYIPKNCVPPEGGCFW
jgi:hypothetical protein